MPPLRIAKAAGSSAARSGRVESTMTRRMNLATTCKIPFVVPVDHARAQSPCRKDARRGGVLLESAAQDRFWCGNGRRYSLAVARIRYAALLRDGPPDWLRGRHRSAHA